ncbi:MAG: DNA polymerase I [Planctomycetota bacterium]|jgi:DNA polymerase-1
MSAAKKRKTLYLIDGHAQFFRAYHALPVGMASPVTKEPTNLTFGFVGMLLKLLREYKPDYLAVVIDVAGDRESFRSQLYPEYKANRTETPEDFHPQVERCLEVLEQMKVPVIGQEAVEADDVIATLVRRYRQEHPELDIRVVSKDKDLAQVLGDHVQLFDVHTDVAVTAAQLFKTEGVEPEHVVQILALMGDNIDNIPGVPGIGPKTAAKLVLEYGSIENLLAHIDQIKGKRRENLEACRDQLPLNVELVKLRDDLDVDLDLDRAEVDVGQLPREQLLATFRELGFTRHTEELQRLLADEPNGGGAAEPAAPADSLFGDLTAPVSAAPGASHVFTTIAELETLGDRCREAGTFAIRIEGDADAAMRANLCGVAVAIEPGEAWYVPVRSPDGGHLGTEAALATLGPLLEDESISKVGHNLKDDITRLRRHRVRLRGCAFDIMVASYVVDATRASHGLDVLALALLGHACTPRTELLGKGRDRRAFDAVPLERAAASAAELVDLTLRLRDAFAPQLESLGLRSLFDDVEMPLVDVLSDLEFNGIRVDPEELEQQRVRLAERIDELAGEIQGEAPHPFNPDSPKQLAAALFNRPDHDPPGLGLPVQKRGKTGPSTDQEVLERLCAHPEVTSRLPELIVEYRQLTKLVSTYLVALVDAINPDTGRVHASFNQTVAPEHVLLTADYSQIELRLLAHLSQDPALIDAFRQGHDIHTSVAAEVYGIAPDEVTSAQRTTAKMVNFGIVYGITPFGLARRLGPEVSVEQAGQIIADYKARFEKIEQFLSSCVQAAIEHGSVETILGRRRAIPQIHARSPQQRSYGERMAINTVVQGSAADLIKLAMIHLHRELPERFPAARMVLQIHDELVFEVPAGEVEELRDFVVERMRQAMQLSVDLVVDTAWSESWIDA